MGISLTFPKSESRVRFNPRIRERISVAKSASRRRMATSTHSLETAIHIRSIDIRIQAISSVGRETGSDIRENTNGSLEIAIYWLEIATCIQEIAADIQEIATNIEEIAIYSRRTAACRRETTAIRHFPITSAIYSVLSRESDRRSLLIRRRQAEDVAKFRPQGPTTYQAHPPAPAKKLGRFDQVNRFAVAEGFPFKSVCAIEHHFKRFRRPALALARAIEHIHERRPGANIRVGNQDDRMFSSIRKVKPPDVKLVFHSGNRSELPLASADSSLLLSWVRYSSKLPLGNGSLASALTSVSVSRPSP